MKRSELKHLVEQVLTEESATSIKKLEDTIIYMYHNSISCHDSRITEVYEEALEKLQEKYKKITGTEFELTNESVMKEGIFSGVFNLGINIISYIEDVIRNGKDARFKKEVEAIDKATAKKIGQYIDERKDMIEKWGSKLTEKDYAVADELLSRHGLKNFGSKKK